MRNLILIAAVASMLVMTSGCADGPIRKWFRGSACNTCQPPLGQPFGCGTNVAPGCNTGVCGTGVPASISGNELNNPGAQSYYGTQNGGVIPQNDAYGNATNGDLNFNTPNIGNGN